MSQNENAICGIFIGCLFGAALWALFIMAAGMLSGCRTTPDQTADSYPPQIAAQCARAKAEAIRKWGQPPYPFWTVSMTQGRRVGSQWAIKQGGRLVGGYTMGAMTVIGCGPNGEIAYGDLLHEAGEYATWQDGRMHQ